MMKDPAVKVIKVTLALILVFGVVLPLFGWITAFFWNQVARELSLPCLDLLAGLALFSLIQFLRYPWVHLHHD